MALRVFTDFDGTVTQEDVGNALFLRFCGDAWHGLVQRYRAGEISACEYYLLCAEAAGTVDLGAVEEFLAGQRIDPHFGSFAEFCAERGIGLTIVSDGMDYYIGRILERHGVRGVPYFANRLELVDAAGGGKRLKISFPHADGASSRWACSKRAIMVTQAAEDDIIAYVGEGFSDRVPVEYADIVFAKDALQTWCQQRNISYYWYASFQDVRERCEKLLARPRLRKRREAEIKRRALFAAE